MKRATLQSYEDIFHASGSDTDDMMTVPLEELHDFEMMVTAENGEEILYEHPFKVVIDDRMMELAEDIKKNGVIQPGLAIHREQGGYTLIAGHRRKCAAGLAGLKEMPIRVKELTPQEAIDYMYGSNLQRPEILPSEKAKSYQMIYGAYKKQGSRTDLTKQSVGMKKFIEEEENESIRTIYRYIALTNLIEPFLNMMDSKQLKITTAYELSFLLPEEQKELLKIIHIKKIFPSLEQAEKLHRVSKETGLTEAVIDVLMEKSGPAKRVVLKPDKINQYFPTSMSGKEKEAVIYKLLEEWSRKNTSDAAGDTFPGQTNVEQWDNGKYMPE